MNAQIALKAAGINKPSVIDREYKSIIKSIEAAIKSGSNDTLIGFNEPRKEVMVRLEEQGYWLYSIGDNWACPKMYGVSWDKREPKKKWYHRVFCKAW